MGCICIKLWSHHRNLYICIYLFKVAGGCMLVYISINTNKKEFYIFTDYLS